jgi:PDZ domain
VARSTRTVIGRARQNSFDDVDVTDCMPAADMETAKVGMVNAVDSSSLPHRPSTRWIERPRILILLVALWQANVHFAEAWSTRPSTSSRARRQFHVFSAPASFVTVNQTEDNLVRDVEAADRESYGHYLRSKYPVFREVADVEALQLLDIRVDPPHRPLGCSIEESIVIDTPYVFVSKVNAETPASRSGLQPGDVVVSVFDAVPVHGFSSTTTGFVDTVMVGISRV